MATTNIVPDEVVVVRYAGILARPAMRELAAMKVKYPRSYSRERVMEEADRILDMCLDNAATVVAQYPADEARACIVCDGRGCEFCAAVRHGV